MWGLSPVAASRVYSSWRCACFSLQWLLLLWNTGSRHTGFNSCSTRALELRLSSCGTQAYLLHSMWDLPGPGLEPMSPALAGGFLTTAPPGRFLILIFDKIYDRTSHSHSISFLSFYSQTQSSQTWPETPKTPFTFLASDQCRFKIIYTPYFIH